MSTSSGDPGQQGWGPPQQQGYSYGQGSGYPGSPGYGGYQQAPGYGQAPGPSGAYGNRPLASRGKRLAASLLDGIGSSVVMIPVFVVFFVLVAAGGSTSDPSGDPSGGGAAAILLGFALLFFGAVAVSIAWYVWWPVRTNGQTPAKQVLGLRMVKEDGQPFGWGPAFIRWLVFGFLGWISAIFCLFDDRKRCLHDMAAGTVVVPD